MRRKTLDENTGGDFGGKRDNWVYEESEAGFNGRRGHRQDFLVLLAHVGSKAKENQAEPKVTNVECSPCTFDLVSLNWCSLSLLPSACATHQFLCFSQPKPVLVSYKQTVQQNLSSYFALL
jgi:hypothetical protein